MNYSDIQHRFANKQTGKNGCVRSGNVRYEGRNYYSYSTVFGQWLDMEKNVVAIFDGSTSHSSSKHKLGKWCFPDDVHVFPLDFGGSYYGWRNCNLVGECWRGGDECFKEYHRMQMIDHYVERIYNQIAAINGGKKKGLENVSFEAWDYITELCSLYKDTSINKYLKWTKDNKDYKKLAKLLKDGERNVEVLTDALFGEGTFKKYWDYCSRYRKSADKRAKIEALCERLGIESPYESWSRGRMDTELTADQIRKLTAKERLDLHFKALIYNMDAKFESKRKEKYNRNSDNAYKWITGYAPKLESKWNHEYRETSECRNMFTGQVYELPKEYIYGFCWAKKSVKFDYDQFRKADDKEQWICSFYAECEEVQDNRKALEILKRVGAHTREKQHSYDDDRFIDDDFLRENTSPSEYIICAEFIRKQDKHYADEEAQRRAREIARILREEEERKEREYMKQVKQEQIDECLERGVEGCRDLWRKHLLDIHTASYRSNEKDNVYYYGGNVLLRLNLNKDKVETSKGIRIPVEVCKKMWKIVSKWHENPSCFKSMVIDTKGSGKYTISSYQNDILTAGCHKIAYTEMERMYNEIQGL